MRILSFPQRQSSVWPPSSHAGPGPGRARCRALRQPGGSSKWPFGAQKLRKWPPVEGLGSELCFASIGKKKKFDAGPPGENFRPKKYTQNQDQMARISDHPQVRRTLGCSKSALLDTPHFFKNRFSAFWQIPATMEAEFNSDVKDRSQRVRGAQMSSE